jgi:hypothetical protein
VSRQLSEPMRSKFPILSSAFLLLTSTVFCIEMASSRQLTRPSDLPLMMGLFDDTPWFPDPFSAILPFSAGASRTAPSGRHRAMPLDVKEVRLANVRRRRHICVSTTAHLHYL